MRRFMWVLVLAGCKSDGPPAHEPPAAPARQLAGVYPEKWQCDSVAPPAALAEVLGGPVKPIDSPMSVPRGVPHPCSYEVSVAGPAIGSGSAAPGPALEYWTFDIDCRDGMKPRADALFAQYKQTSQELVDQYAAAADAGARQAGSTRHHGAHEPDASVEAAPPSPATDVAVGARGLDHHGQGLLFIDDDAPCYVRVVGKDAGRRLALARLLATNLTFANAPMTPRAAP